MDPVKYYIPPAKPVIPPLLTLLVAIAGAILFGTEQDTFYLTFISCYFVIIAVSIIGFVSTVLLYKLQTGISKREATAKYFFPILLCNSLGISGMVAYLFLNINYKKADKPHIMHLPVIEQYAWNYKGNISYYVVVDYQKQTARLKIDKLPSPPAKTVTVQVAHGYFGYPIVENYKVDQ